MKDSIFIKTCFTFVKTCFFSLYNMLICVVRRYTLKKQCKYIKFNDFLIKKTV